MPTDANRDSMERYRRYIFAVLLTGYFLVVFHRMSVGAVGGEMVSDVGGGTKEYLSSIYFWTYALMQIPAGLLADSLGPKKASVIFLAVASIGSFVTAIADAYWMLAVGKCLIAAGMAVVYIPLVKIISVWYKKADFSYLNGVVIAVGNVGALAAAAPLRMLADAFGWRDVFVVLGIATVILAILCYLVIRDHPKDMGMPPVDDGSSDGDDSSAKVPLSVGLIAVAKGGRMFWNMSLAYFLVYGTIIVFQGTVGIDYFTKGYGFAYGAWFITSLGIGKIASTIVIGKANSKGLVSSKKRLMTFGTVCFAAIWGIIWLFAGDIQSQLFWLSMCTAFGFFGGFMTLSFTQVKEWYPISVAGTVTSSMNLMLFLGAAVLTAVAGNVLSGSYTTENYSTLWLIMFVSSIIACILVMTSKERTRFDELVHLKPKF